MNYVNLQLAINDEDYAEERIKKEKKDKLDKLHNQKLIKK
jgi:hypothetical protein